MHPPRRDFHLGSDPEQPQSQRLGTRLRQFGASQRLADHLDQNKGEGRQLEAECVGVKQGGRETIREHVPLVLLHAVLGIPAGTVEFLVEGLGRMGRSRERSHDKARVGLAAARSRQNLGLGNNPPAAAPALQRPPPERAEPTRRCPGLHAANPRAPKRLGNPLLQPAVAGQADDSVNPCSLGPRKNRLAAETGIGAQDDAHIRPVLPDLPNHSVKYRRDVGRHILPGTAQKGQHWHAVAKHQERQSAVFLVSAMEELPFLIAVQRHVGGTRVEDDLLRWYLVTLDEQFHLECVHRIEVGHNLAVFAHRLPRRRQLPAVQGALASQRGAVGAAGLDLVECHANGRVMAQSVVVIEIFVAHGNAKNTLANQRLDVMDHQVRLAGINETPDQPRYQAAAPVGLAL